MKVYELDISGCDPMPSFWQEGDPTVIHCIEGSHYTDLDVIESMMPEEPMQRWKDVIFASGMYTEDSKDIPIGFGFRGMPPGAVLTVKLMKA